jgi:hypothetical protein
MDDLEGLDAATEGLNAGAQIAQVEPSLIEHIWKALSRIPLSQRQSTGVCVAAQLEPSLAPPSPEQQLAMMVRYALLNALIERDILDDYMKDETLRKKVFATAARLLCDKNDLREAVAERVLPESPSDIAQKTKERLERDVYDPDHLKVAEKFIAWIRDNC